MDKQIKEIASDLSKAVIQDYGGVYFLETAKELYDLGYRKIPEGAVVVSKQVWEEHIENWDKTTKAVEERVRKETAEKYHAEIEKAIESVPNATKEFVEAWREKNDEITKEITEAKYEIHKL